MMQAGQNSNVEIRDRDVLGSPRAVITTMKNNIFSGKLQLEGETRGERQARRRGTESAAANTLGFGGGLQKKDTGLLSARKRKPSGAAAGGQTSSRHGSKRDV